MHRSFNQTADHFHVINQRGFGPVYENVIENDVNGQHVQYYGRHGCKLAMLGILGQI